MINNIRIRNHELIDGIDITDIPKITVICGPNNSGKSTTLNAIRGDDSKVGIKVTDELINDIFDEYIINTQFRNANNTLTGAGKIIKSIFIDVLGDVDRLYEGFYDEHIQTIAQKYKRNLNLQRTRFEPNRVISSLSSRLTKPIHCYLPPKRNLESEIVINGGLEVIPNGEGLANFLFYSKNRPENSYEHVLFLKISEAFCSISSGYRFNVFLEENNNLKIQFSPEKDLWLNTEQCGLGLQDLLVILYFSITKNNNIVCIEEPESHMHPDMQRKLLYYLKSLGEKQFFITSHSNVYLNNSTTDRVLVTKYLNEKIIISDATSTASILNDLGYSVTDNLVSDLVVLVEGPSDVPVLEELLVKIGLNSKYAIKIWPLGGDIMDQLDLSVFSEHYKILALLDSDPGSSKVRNRFNKKCNENNIPVHVLKRYAIENYFSIDALNKVFGNQIPESLTELAHDKTIESQIRINVKKNNRKIKIFSFYYL